MSPAKKSKPKKAQKTSDAPDTDQSVQETPEKNTVVVASAQAPEEPSQQDVHEKHGKVMYISGGVVLAFIITTSIGLVFARSVTPDRQMAVVEPTLNPQDLQPTPTPALDRTAWEIEVLNGSGVAGAAGDARDALEALGYTVVAVGNADAQTYTTSELSVVDTLTSQVPQFIVDVADVVTLTTSIASFEGSEATARIILGSE